MKMKTTKNIPSLKSNIPVDHDLQADFKKITGKKTKKPNFDFELI